MKKSILLTALLCLLPVVSYGQKPIETYTYGTDEIHERLSQLKAIHIIGHEHALRQHGDLYCQTEQHRSDSGQDIRFAERRIVIGYF